MIQPLEITYCDNDKNKFYYSIIDGIIYYNNYFDKTTCAIKNKKHYTIFKNSCLTHNFRPFKYKDRYYGIGGQDNWKVDKKWRGLSYEDFMIEYKNHFNKEYIRGPVFYEQIKYKFDTTPVMPHNHGLYLLESDDLINWKFVQNNPIITAKNDGFNHCLEWKSAEFDSISEVIKFKDKWFIYLRNNVSQDRRDIQASWSDDLVEWDTFESINHDYDIEHDNYYCPIIFEHNKQLFGFFNYYNSEKSSVKLKQSYGGFNWDEVCEFFVEFPHEIYEKTIKKTKLNSIVCSVHKTDYNIFFWVNHFYASNNKYHNSYVAKYKIPIGEFNELL